MGKKIWCTLGPASLKDGIISRLDELGVHLFRLNLSHTKIEDLAEVIQYVQGRTSVPLCLDTEGAQIRTGDLIDGKIHLRENSVLNINRQPVPGDSNNLNLYPSYIVDELQVGDFITLDASALVQIIDTAPDTARAQVLCGGEVGQNKAVTVHRDIVMPALTRKDLEALDIGRELGIRHVALSFANRASDVDEIRKAFREDAFVVSKIECRNALNNLEEIAARSDALLIDRGDLSRHVPVEQIPKLQKNIIERADKQGRKVYVATNLMESMVTLPFPTRAEVNDVYNTLEDGVDGLVLAAETAIGNYPIGCASMVLKVIREFENGSQSRSSSLPTAPISLIVEPHGGELVDQIASTDLIDDSSGLGSLTVRDTDLMDCEQIANGTYSPLTGFMCRDELDSVLNTNRLPSGLPWTMPIVLQVDDEDVPRVGKGERIVLKRENGDIHALLDVKEIYSFEFEPTCKAWFGTTSMDHPGVARLASRGRTLLGGDVTLMRSIATPFDHYKLAPAQTRFVFAQKGWNKVVGFHSRNVPHRAHEYIQVKSLEYTHADGLLITPVIGPQKPGDFLPDPIMKSYQLIIDFGFLPRGKVVLGCFSTYPRYCGPREAVFTAICRKNMGCSHFIVGRDHTGVGDFYRDDDIRRLFDELNDVGVTPVFFDTVGFNPKTQMYGTVESADSVKISGSKMRDMLRQNEELPKWFMRDVVQEMLRTAIARHENVFYA